MSRCPTCGCNCNGEHSGRIGGYILTFGEPLMPQSAVPHPPLEPMYGLRNHHMMYDSVYNPADEAIRMRQRDREMWRGITSDLDMYRFDKIRYRDVPKDKTWEKKGFIPESGEDGIRPELSPSEMNRKRAQRKRERQARKKARR